MSTILIAAAGYVINDILDQETDHDNKPNYVIIGKSISEKAAYNFYFILNITGVGIGFYLSNVIMRPGFSSIFILEGLTKTEIEKSSSNKFDFCSLFFIFI